VEVEGGVAHACCEEEAEVGEVFEQGCGKGSAFAHCGDYLVGVEEGGEGGVVGGVGGVEGFGEGGDFEGATEGGVGGEDLGGDGGVVV